MDLHEQTAVDRLERAVRRVRWAAGIGVRREALAALTVGVVTDDQIAGNGSTRLLYLQPRHRKLEIGWTWLHPAYWAGPVNPECKLLLLTFCFETLGTSRVQLKTDANNIRSRKAIEKIGGAFEGILRNDMLRADGSKRHSAYYGLIEEEWPGRKAALQALLQRARS